MDNKKWALVTSVLLIAGIVVSAYLYKQRNDARQNLHERIEQITDLDRQKADLKSQLAQQELTLSSLDENLKTSQSAIQAKDKYLSESKNLLVTLQAENARLEKQRADSKELLTSLQAEIDRLNNQLAASKYTTDILREQMLMAERQNQKTLKGLEERIASQSSALAESNNSLKSLEQDKATLMSRLKQANQTIVGLRDQIKEAMAQVPELRDQLEKRMEQYQVVREDLNEARDRQAKLEAQQAAMKDAYENLVTGLKQQLDAQEARIEKYREKFKVTFVDKILFGFSQVRINPKGEKVLDQLAGALANIPEGKVTIIGHTDNIPVAENFRYRFPSNWELSSARAAAVARYLLKKGKLAPARIETVGLSYHQPVAENDTETGRAKNRRVEIIISPGRYPQ